MADSITFLQALIGAQREGEAAVQRLVADAARGLGCEVETVRYRPADVPMVGEFAVKMGMTELGKRVIPEKKEFIHIALMK